MKALKDLEQYIDGAVAHFSKKLQDRLGQNTTVTRVFCSTLRLRCYWRSTLHETIRLNGFFVQIEDVLRSGARLGQIHVLYLIHDFLSPVIGNHLGITARHGALRDFA